MANLKLALRSAFEDGTTYGTVNSNGYLYSFLDNVYDNKMSIEHQQMFDHGSGGELHSKAEAVHSSSMFGYNLAHNLYKKCSRYKSTTAFFKIIKLSFSLCLQQRYLLNNNHLARL